jgi:peroxiredoxin
MRAISNVLLGVVLTLGVAPGADADDDESIVGRVIGVDGRPAAGVSVEMSVYQDNTLYVVNHKIHSREEILRETTDAQGKFRLERVYENFVLRAADSHGVAMMTSRKLPPVVELKLRPWARLAGVVKVGGRFDASRKVGVETAWEEHGFKLSDIQFARPGQEGRFHFERVMPGWAVVGRTEPDNEAFPYDMKWIDAEPGGIEHIVLGGVGRPVVGRVTFPTDTNPPRISHDSRAILFRKQAPPPFPPESATWSDQQKQEWRLAWDNTPDGLAYKREANKHCACVEPDGKFRIEDVPPGRYSLVVTLYQRLEDAPADEWPRIVGGGVVPEVEIPTIPGGLPRKDEPLRLAPLESDQHISAPKVGERAPDFSSHTFDDKPLRASDYRGRLVLIHFWTTWSKPSVAELPHLKATYEAFASDKRFAMIGINLDGRIGAPRPFVEAHQLGWVQAQSGPWASAEVTQAYDLHTLPSTWLIGPHGKILARDLHGPAIREAIAKALREP